MAKLHTMYAAIVMLLVGVKIQCANSTNATLFSPLMNNSTSPNGTLLSQNETQPNGTLGADPSLLKDGSPTMTTLIPITSTIHPNMGNENSTDDSTTEKSTTTTKDPQLMLIPPAEVNASIAQMHNAPRKKGQIIIR